MSKINEAFAWFDKEAKEGKEVEICWEGGGDSGWAYFQVDGSTIENEHTELVVNLMYDKLDYGSWAGEFHACGTAKYDPETKTFEGEDNCYTDDSTSIDISEKPIVFEIPKHFAFDLIGIMTEDENCYTTAGFHGMNRFKRPDEEDFLDKLAQKIREEIIERTSVYQNSSGASGNEITSFWNEYSLRRSEMTDNGDSYVAVITEIHFTEEIADSRYMIIDLEEMLENEE